MAVKLVLTWDILPEHQQDYFEFVIGEFVPGVQRLGLQPIEAWATMYGDYPQIQVGMLGDNLRGVQQILRSSGWKQLQDKLFEMVKNYSFKIITARNGFQF